jgi:hypothetical protein
VPKSCRFKRVTRTVDEACVDRGRRWLAIGVSGALLVGGALLLAPSVFALINPGGFFGAHEPAPDWALPGAFVGLSFLLASFVVAAKLTANPYPYAYVVAAPAVFVGAAMIGAPMSSWIFPLGAAYMVSLRPTSNRVLLWRFIAIVLASLVETSFGALAGLLAVVPAVGLADELASARGPSPADAT